MTPASGSGERGYPISGAVRRPLSDPGETLRSARGTLEMARHPLSRKDVGPVSVLAGLLLPVVGVRDDALGNPDGAATLGTRTTGLGWLAADVRRARVAIPWRLFILQSCSVIMNKAN
jgi:hypothetical protein